MKNFVGTLQSNGNSFYADNKSIIRRKKIWEIESVFLCSVIGTCLELAELHKLCKKMHVSMPSHATDYEWHHAFVGVASHSSYAAKVLNKYLDKKYKETIKQVFNLNGMELNVFWKESVEKDALSAAYWSILTHPTVSSKLIDKMYGEVHMLSHLSGTTLRIDLEKLKRLERERVVMKTSANMTNVKLQKKIDDTAGLISDLKNKINNINATEVALVEANRIIKRLQSDSNVEVLNNKLSGFENKLDVKIKRIDHLEKSVGEWKQSAMVTGDQLCLAKQQIEELYKENCAMENLMERYLSQNIKPGNTTESNKTNDSLEGSCVLYVGGRDRQCVHFRALVEQKNGTFIHHDGGLNDGCQRLGSLLPKADMVFCPIDCISHNAVNRVKQFCNRSGKPLVMMRQASLSAFTKGLSELVS